MKNKIPVLTKEAQVEITISYTEAAALINTLFSLIKTWTPEETEQFKALIEGKKAIESINHLTYVVIDGLYRKILQRAQETDQVSWQEMPSPQQIVQDL